MPEIITTFCDEFGAEIPLIETITWQGDTYCLDCGIKTDSQQSDEE